METMPRFWSVAPATIACGPYLTRFGYCQRSCVSGGERADAPRHDVPAGCQQGRFFLSIIHCPLLQGWSEARRFFICMPQHCYRETCSTYASKTHCRTTGTSVDNSATGSAVRATIQVLRWLRQHSAGTHAQEGNNRNWCFS